MNGAVCIEGWRQQSQRREQILAWLNEAKQLGFERYSLLQQGRCYWLCCCHGKDYDAVIAIRQQVDMEAAVVVQLWQQQLLLVAWQQDTLLGACQFSADQHGVDALFYVAQAWLSPEAMDCPLLIAGAATQALLAGKTPAELSPQLLRELITGRYSSAAQLRSIKRSPAWIRRKVLVRGIAASFFLAAAVSWWLWPSVTDQPEPAMRVQPIAIEPVAGAQAQQLLRVPELLRAVTYLAGWQVTQWQLDGTTERLIAQASYGNPNELLTQLSDPNWKIQAGTGTTQVTRALAGIERSQALMPQQPTLESLQAAGWRIEEQQSSIQVGLHEFDPFQAEAWQSFIAWLAQQPEARVVAASGTRNGHFWQLTIEVQQPLHGAQL